MIVTVMYRNNWFGGDGWACYPKTIEISNKCPVCGELRGNPYAYNFCEDGEWFTVDKWDNPCGHIDKYADVILEAEELRKLPVCPDCGADNIRHNLSLDADTNDYICMECGGWFKLQPKVTL